MAVRVSVMSSCSLTGLAVAPFPAPIHQCGLSDVSHLPGEAAHCRHAQVYHHPRRRTVLQTVAAYKWAARSLPSPLLSMSSLGPWPSALQTCHPLAQIRVPSLLPFAELFPGHLEHL